MRGVLLFVAVCAVLAALWAAYIEPYRREQSVLAEMQGKQFAVVSEAVGPGWLQWFARGKFAQRVVRVDLGKDVTDADLARLSELVELRTLMIAQGPAITDAGLAHVAELPALRALMLAETHVTNEGLNRLKSAHGLRELWISSDRLGDDALITIGGLRELQSLSVQAQVTDGGMQHLASLTKLEALRCPSPDPQVERHRSVLALPTEFDFVEAPLLDACQSLAEAHGTPLRLDHQAFEAAGIDPLRLTVTATRQDEPFGDCLASLLRPHGLVVRVEPAGLVVTTRAAEEQNRQGITALQRALPALKQVDVWW